VRCPGWPAATAAWISCCPTSSATSRSIPRGAELLFQVITEREEQASIAIGTNLPFSEWGTVFPDPRLVAAIVDRVTFNARILKTGTQSYRLRTSKTATRSTKTG
jgi:DNA replication protein DnaC